MTGVARSELLEEYDMGGWLLNSGEVGRGPSTLLGLDEKELLDFLGRLPLLSLPVSVQKYTDRSGVSSSLPLVVYVRYYAEGGSSDVIRSEVALGESDYTVLGSVRPPRRLEDLVLVTRTGPQPAVVWATPDYDTLPLLVQNWLIAHVWGRLGQLLTGSPCSTQEMEICRGWVDQLLGESSIRR